MDQRLFRRGSAELAPGAGAEFTRRPSGAWVTPVVGLDGTLVPGLAGGHPPG